MCKGMCDFLDDFFRTENRQENRMCKHDSIRYIIIVVMLLQSTNKRLIVAHLHPFMLYQTMIICSINQNTASTHHDTTAQIQNILFCRNNLWSVANPRLTTVHYWTGLTSWITIPLDPDITQRVVFLWIWCSVTLKITNSWASLGRHSMLLVV